MVSVLSIPIFSQSLERAVQIVADELHDLESEGNRLVSATGAHGLVIAQRNEQFANLLNSFYRNLPDGVPAVWVGKLKGARKMERCYGPDFFGEVMVASKDKEVNHFFCGGKEGVADELKRVCEEKFGNYNCVGTFSPPFREMSPEELRSLGDTINKSGADIVWIGLSTPKQELFAKRLSDFVKVKFIITVGAAFDFHTGKLREAPRFIQIIGLEWLFRMVVEPKRLAGRYFKIVPAFLFYGTIDVLSFYYRKLTGRTYANS